MLIGLKQCTSNEKLTLTPLHHITCISKFTSIENFFSIKNEKIVFVLHVKDIHKNILGISRIKIIRCPYCRQTGRSSSYWMSMGARCFPAEMECGCCSNTQNACWRGPTGSECSGEIRRGCGTWPNVEWEGKC